MDELTVRVPAVSTLATMPPSIEGGRKVPDVEHTLLNHPEILCFPVSYHGKIVGFIYNREFHTLMAHQYMKELHIRKTAREIAEPPIFRARTHEKITDVLSALLKFDRESKVDSIVLYDGDSYAGIVMLTDLMLAISDTQNHLIQQMDRMSARLRQEVKVTSQLQRSIMPHKKIEIGNYIVDGRLVTSSEVGGDFFDYFTIDNRYLALAIGDVSGHGVPAGMLVTTIKSALHSLPDESLYSPAKALRHLNKALLSARLGEMLMTFFYMVIDTEKDTASYAHAGHNFPYRYDSWQNKWATLGEGVGLPLGLDPDTCFTESRILMGSNDCLLLYTDGLVEDTNADNLEFGYDSLELILSETAPEHFPNIVERVLDGFYRFKNSLEVSDDVTLISVVRNGQNAEANANVMLLKSAYENPVCMAQELLSRERLSVIDGADSSIKGAESAPVVMTQSFYDSLIHELPYLNEGCSPVLLAERPISKQISNITRNGIHRVLQSGDRMLSEIGLELLLNGSGKADQFFCLRDICSHLFESTVTHTGQKESVISAILNSAESSGFTATRPDLPDALALVTDEMLENAFLAAPVDILTGKNAFKGQSRALEETETIHVTYGYNRRLFVLSVTDYWGNFSAQKLLHYLSKSVYGISVQAGVGGAGLQIAWRFSDYLHVHSIPGKLTTFTVFYSGDVPSDPERDKCFQLTVSQSGA